MDNVYLIIIPLHHVFTLLEVTLIPPSPTVLPICFSVLTGFSCFFLWLEGVRGRDEEVPGPGEQTFSGRDLAVPQCGQASCFFGVTKAGFVRKDLVVLLCFRYYASLVLAHTATRLFFLVSRVPSTRSIVIEQGKYQV